MNAKKWLKYASLVIISLAVLVFFAFKLSPWQYAQTASVIDVVDQRFPPAFISAGNGAPLLPQSLELAKKMKSVGIKTETLFFPDDKKPALEHEYQFDLGTDEGQMALKRSIDFLIASVD